MAAFDWHSFLQGWSCELIECDDIARHLPPEIRASGWLGFPGATEDEIARAETRLRKKLPPSYRAFLGVTNGWRYTGFAINHLWSTDKIYWFRVRNQEWIDDWGRGAEYYELRNPGPVVPHPDDERPDLPFTLEISDVGDSAIYLLNPRIVGADGEWQAWFFSNWTPGAQRYHSFEAMIVEEHKHFIYVRDHRH
jgi:SMI1 / KNR4 family (SUKH-1)